MPELSLIDDGKAVTPKKDRARMLTEEIRAEIQQSFENFYHVGMKLKQVQWKYLGYKSLNEYMRKEFDMSGRQAYRLIAAAELRPKLPELTYRSTDQRSGWTETHLRELLRLETQQDQIRVARKVCQYLEKNPDEKVTAKLVKRFVDGWKAPKPPKKKKAVKGEGNVHNILMKWVYQMEDWCNDLKDIPKEGWTLLREQHPDVVKSFTGACDSLANFAREVNTNASNAKCS